MTRSELRTLAATAIACLIPVLASAQLPTGTITGHVADNTGAVMPGVTVTLTGERLIGGSRAEATNARGQYRFVTLVPGAYDLKFELAGFKAVVRQGIEVSGGFVASVNVTLEVGSLEETVTVVGESPTVDTKSNVQQAVMGQRLLEGLPTGRDVWSVAKIVPSVVVGAYDVGGTQGMQQTSLSAHGSVDRNYAIDGVSVNWPGRLGTETMLYYDQGMYEEVDYQTSAIPAEVAMGGVHMNMVTKAGGNWWRGQGRAYFANDSLQSTNFADVSAKYNFPGGNPVTKQYDVNGEIGGPVLADKIWFFSSYRRWRVDKKLLASFNPDGSNAIDNNMIWNASAKLTFQFDPSNRVGLLYNFNQKNRYHRRGWEAQAPETFVDDKATVVQMQPAYVLQAKYSGVMRGSSILESTLSMMRGTYPQHYQKEVQPTDLRRVDSVRSTATGAAWSNYDNPNYRLQFDNTFSHTRVGLGGSHNLKAGAQFTRMYFQERTRMNGDMRLIYADGVPYQVRVFNTPVTATSYIQQLGIFGQDSWLVGRKLTLNIGARFDRATGWYPGQTSPAGTFVPAREIQRTDVYNQWIGVWRAGAVYDLRGDGKTAVKANVSRYAQAAGISLVTNVHPLNLSWADLAWNDANRNEYPESSELSSFGGFVGGATSHYADANGPAWGYSDEVTAGIEHEVMKDVRAAAMYYHRTNRNLIGSSNVLVPESAYSPVTIANPLGGTLTFHNLNSAFLGKQENVRDNVDLMDNTFDGVDVSVTKRFTNRWQMLFGFAGGRTTGGLDLGANFADPNNLINQQGVVGTDVTYQFKLSGSYVIPRAEVTVAGSLLRNSGFPRQFSYVITRSAYPALTRSSQTVYVNRRGDERLPSVAMIDLRFSRAFRLARNFSVEPLVEIFNLTNSDAIVTIVDAVGSRLSYPSEILAPRIVRVGFAVGF